MEKEKQLNNESAFYWSIGVLRRLRDMGLLSQKEYEIICSISAKHYSVDVYLCLKR